VLKWELRHAPPARTRILAAELLRRVRAPATTREDYGKIVDLAIDHQGDLARPWVTELGDIIEQADQDCRLSHESLARYRKQAAVWTATARPRARAGDPIPVTIALKESRTGSGTDLSSILYDPSLSIEGESLKRFNPPSTDTRRRQYLPEAEWFGYIQ